MTEAKHTFDSLNLLPGQIMQLEFDDYEQSRDKTMLLGYLKGRSIIITTPSRNGIAIAVKPESQVKVRLFVNQINGACAFQTRVQHVTALPFAHLYLHMPEQLVIGEVRKSIRAKVHIVASAMVPDGDKRKTISAIIDDLSTNGARIQCQQLKGEENQEIDLVFKISVSGLERILHIRAIVRSSQYNEAKQLFFYGLQFIEVEETDTITLHAFVLSKLHTRD